MESQISKPRHTVALNNSVNDCMAKTKFRQGKQASFKKILGATKLRTQSLNLAPPWIAESKIKGKLTY